MNRACGHTKHLCRSFYRRILLSEESKYPVRASSYGRVFQASFLTFVSRRVLCIDGIWSVISRSQDTRGGHHVRITFILTSSILPVLAYISFLRKYIFKKIHSAQFAYSNFPLIETLDSKYRCQLSKGVGTHSSERISLIEIWCVCRLQEVISYPRVFIAPNVRHIPQVRNIRSVM